MMETHVARSEVRMNRAEIDQLAEKFGGRFKLTVLIQKRVKELTRGAAKLVELESRNLIHVAMEEIRQGKIGIMGYETAEEREKNRRKAEKAEKAEKEEASSAE